MKHKKEWWDKHYKANREYYIQKSRKWRQDNRERHLAYSTTWNKNNSRPRSKIMRRHAYKKYGITEDEYFQMLHKQQRKCELCGTDNPGNKRTELWCIDHDHSTGKVRGLLCWRCNLSVGWYERNKHRIDKIEVYLSR